jgi:hypothetical protein
LAAGKTAGKSLAAKGKTEPVEPAKAEEAMVAQVQSEQNGDGGEETNDIEQSNPEPTAAAPEQQPPPLPTTVEPEEF